MSSEHMWQGTTKEQSIQDLIRCAEMLNTVQGVDWYYRLGDDGQVAFFFASDDLLCAFRAVLGFK
jgi:hypothetical protein